MTKHRASSFLTLPHHLYLSSVNGIPGSLVSAIYWLPPRTTHRKVGTDLLKKRPSLNLTQDKFEPLEGG